MCNYYAYASNCVDTEQGCPNFRRRAKFECLSRKRENNLYYASLTAQTAITDDLLTRKSLQTRVLCSDFASFWQVGVIAEGRWDPADKSFDFSSVPLVSWWLMTDMRPKYVLVYDCMPVFVQEDARVSYRHQNETYLITHSLSLWTRSMGVWCILMLPWCFYNNAASTAASHSFVSDASKRMPRALASARALIPWCSRARISVFFVAMIYIYLCVYIYIHSRTHVLHGAISVSESFILSHECLWLVREFAHQFDVQGYFPWKAMHKKIRESCSRRIAGWCPGCNLISWRL